MSKAGPSVKAGPSNRSPPVGAFANMMSGQIGNQKPPGQRKASPGPMNPGAKKAGAVTGVKKTGF